MEKIKVNFNIALKQIKLEATYSRWGQVKFVEESL